MSFIVWLLMSASLTGLLEFLLWIVGGDEQAKYWCLLIMPTAIFVLGWMSFDLHDIERRRRAKRAAEYWRRCNENNYQI